MKLWFDNYGKKECMSGYPFPCEFCELRYECDKHECEHFDEYQKYSDTFVYYKGNLGELLTLFSTISFDGFRQQLRCALYNDINYDLINFDSWLEYFSITKSCLDSAWTIFLILSDLWNIFSQIRYSMDMDRVHTRSDWMSVYKRQLMYFECCIKYLSMNALDNINYDIKKFEFAEKVFFDCETYLTGSKLSSVEISHNIKSKNEMLGYYSPDRFIMVLDDNYNDTISSIYSEFENYDEVYDCESLDEFAFIETKKILSSKLTVKLCKNCNLPFIPYNRSDEIYCERKSPQDNKKTCKQYGAMKSYQNNLKTNEAMGLYRKIYMSKQMLSRRNPDIKEYADSFEKYKEQSKQWKSEVKAGTKTEAEYIEWLKSVKEKKVL